MDNSNKKTYTIFDQFNINANSIVKLKQLKAIKKNKIKEKIKRFNVLDGELEILLNEKAKLNTELYDNMQIEISLDEQLNDLDREEVIKKITPLKVLCELMFLLFLITISINSIMPLLIIFSNAFFGTGLTVLSVLALTYFEGKEIINNVIKYKNIDLNNIREKRYLREYDKELINESIYEIKGSLKVIKELINEKINELKAYEKKELDSIKKEIDFMDSIINEYEIKKNQKDNSTDINLEPSYKKKVYELDNESK